MNLFAKPISRLIKGCKANERSAQEGLYKLFYAEMLRVCYRYLKSDRLAGEALNNGFLKAFENIAFYDEQKGELGAWIRTIMVRTCIDLSRREIKFTNTAELAAETEDLFIMPDVLSKLYAEDIIKAIRQLPGATQVVFNLSVVDGYTHKEIGEQLTISESTSRWHLSEAKKQLRNMLKPAENQTDPSTEKIKKAR
jgi:RNA polymerase sigma factor (sigma-70 family)